MAEMEGPRMYKTHLFISYAHMDNQPMVAEQQGWVSRLHASLEAMLSMRMGRKAEIWRDRKLSGNDVFADEILAQFPNTALLISVLTPRYVESDWCMREVREFCRLAEQSGGAVVENKSRVIKVIKTPVESEGPLPPLIKELLGYPFYIFDDEHTPLELDPAYGPDMAQKYNLKVAKLAWDISQQIKNLEAAAPDKTAVTEVVPSKPAIYLAECSWDQRQAREALEAELRLHGYSILPDRQLPRDEAGYVAEVARLLEQSRLSIHLVGASYGAVPDGPTQKSVVVLQNELAVERSKSAGLRRVIWLPEGTESQQPEQLRFIETLHQDAKAQFGADLMICDFETLKGAVHATLEKMAKPAPPASPRESAAGGARLVYLICDERDRKATIPLRKFLKGQGLDVQIPVFEGDAAVVRQENQDLLAQCDAVIVFYGAGDESWKRTVDSDLRKMKGYRGEKPLPAGYTYLAEPATDDKKDLIEMGEPNLVNGLGGFPEAEMQPFLKTLAGA
jgi:TIR domain-containing protein